MTDEADAPPPDSKLTRTKERWAREGRFLTGHNARPEADRLPPGQHLVRDWPVLDLGLHPTVSLERWRLHLTGAVENPQVWGWSMSRVQSQTCGFSTAPVKCIRQRSSDTVG